MKRDGSLKSLWQEGLEDFTPVNEWKKDDVYDIAIIGGGITGLTNALLLQEQGKKCIVIEAHNIGFGTTGGTSAHLNTILDTPYKKIEKDFGEDAAKLVATGAREAIDLIEGLVNKYNIDCDFAYRSGVIFAQNDDEAKQLDEIFEYNEKNGVVTSYTDNIPVPFPFTRACRVAFQAQVHATRYLHGLAKAYEQNGGVILQQCRAGDIKEEDGQLTIYTTLGNVKAGNAIYATHIPPGLNIFSLRCAPYRSYVMACTLTDGAYPDSLAYDLQDPYHYYRTHVINGQPYLIAGGNDHKTGHNDNTEYVFTQLEAYLRTHFDVGTIAYKWSSQYYEPVDGLPYIGRMPGKDHIYLATGFSGNGMVYGTLSAKVLCGIITGAESPYADLFDPGRIKLIAGFTNFVRENADVVSQFINRRIRSEHIEQLAGLAPGEAVVAEWEGKKVALYKDENGHIYALDPVCPHAKCIVTWNSAEKTWDCPCHGARYAPNGDLLNGPSAKNLYQVKWEDIEGD